jgi:pimeloyl-ACP methyl ester carboxylesterase
MMLRTIISGLVLLFSWIILAPGCMTFRLSDEKARADFLRKGLDLKTAFITVNDRQIHYTMVGNDSLPTLIFIHGSPSAWNSFQHFMKDPSLLFHYRMVSVDRPGFGFSDFGDAVNLEEQSLLLLPLIDVVQNGKPVFLAGHSLGGSLVIKMAADYPGAVKGIMLMAGSVDPALEPVENWRILASRFPFYILLPGAFRPSNEELVYFKKDVISLADDFAKVSCEVYLVHGDKDTWVPVGNVDYARKKLVNAAKVETLILPGGNHFIPWTYKKEVALALINMHDSKPLVLKGN